MKKCPKCNSTDVEVIDEEMGFIKCRKCGFDELEEDLSSSEERRSQREKARYNPYKAGGGARGRKK
jgi:Zn ribbon nucleic-acid-binding protein